MVQRPSKCDKSCIVRHGRLAAILEVNFPTRSRALRREVTSRVTFGSLDSAKVRCHKGDSSIAFVMSCFWSGLLTAHRGNGRVFGVNDSLSTIIGHGGGARQGSGYGRVRVGGPASGLLPEPGTRRDKDPPSRDRAAALVPGLGGTRRAVCPRPVAASADPGLLPGDRPPPVLAEERVEGRSEQGLDRPALGGAEHAQLAVDGLGKVAGDLDAAGTAVPGGPAGSGGFGFIACPRRVFLYKAFRSPGQSRLRARRARISSAGSPALPRAGT